MYMILPDRMILNVIDLHNLTLEAHIHLMDSAVHVFL